MLIDPNQSAGKYHIAEYGQSQMWFISSEAKQPPLSLRAKRSNLLLHQQTLVIASEAKQPHLLSVMPNFVPLHTIY
jgi:hypothetical protein